MSSLPRNLACEATHHIGHRIGPLGLRLGHFRGAFWIMAYGRCKDCELRFYNRWATTRRELNSFTEDKRVILAWHWKRLARELRQHAGQSVDYGAPEFPVTASHP